MQELQETWVWSLGQEDPLEEEMATYSSIFARIIPWTEEPGRLQSMGSQRVGKRLIDWITTTTHSIDRVWAISEATEEAAGMGLGSQKVRVDLRCGRCLVFMDWVISFFFFLIFYFFPFISISWRLITLQYCRGFCHRLTWISHGFTCVPHPDAPLPPPSLSHPSGSSQCASPEHLSHASNLGWWSASFLIVYLFQCYLDWVVSRAIEWEDIPTILWKGQGLPAVELLTIFWPFMVGPRSGMAPVGVSSDANVLQWAYASQRLLEVKSAAILALVSSVFAISYSSQWLCYSFNDYTLSLPSWISFIPFQSRSWLFH